MIEKLKKKKVHIAATFGAVAIAGVMLFQGVMPKEAQNPKIDVVSPDQGPAGTQVVISGSGFTTSLEGISGTKVKENTLAPGNYIIVKDEVINQPLISPDGRTLTVNLDLVSAAAKKECDQKFSQKTPQPCKVPVKVINAYGKPSNDVQFTFTNSTYSENKKSGYTITVTQAPNGTITPGTILVKSGATQIFTLVAAPGYLVTGTIVNGVDGGGSFEAQQNYTFSRVSAPYSFTARFSPIQFHTITVTQGTNGTITPGTTSVAHWGSQTFIITPATGYQVASVNVDGVNQGAISTYTFESVVSAHSITAIFSPVSITQSCSLTVSIAPTTPPAQTVSPGQTGVNLVKFNATSNCDGTLNSFAVTLLPMPNGYQNISTLRLYDDVSGIQLGTTQSVAIAGMNFPSINTPLTANQTRVLRVVADVNPSAIIGSTVYGIFGGSSGTSSLGEMIGNNASGNFISGNTMTIR